MANQPIDNPKTYSEILRELTTTDPAHADTFNPLFERLINNDAYLKEKQETQTTQMAELVKFKDVILNFDFWKSSSSQYYSFYQMILDSEMTSDTVINFVVGYAYLDEAKKMLNICKTSDGYYTFYAREKPTKNISITLQIFKQAGGL